MFRPCEVSGHCFVQDDLIFYIIEKKDDDQYQSYGNNTYSVYNFKTDRYESLHTRRELSISTSAIYTVQEVYDVLEQMYPYGLFRDFLRTRQCSLNVSGSNTVPKNLQKSVIGYNLSVRTDIINLLGCIFHNLKK